MLILISTFVLIFYFTRPILVLEASSYPSQEILQYFKLNESSKIGIIYKHSVEKTETSEWYEIEDENLILIEQRYQSQGAGLPANSIYKFEKNENGYRLYDINLEMDNVIYRTGQVIAGHQIDLEGKRIEFTEFSNPGEAVLFRLKNVTNFEFITWRCFNDKR